MTTNKAFNKVFMFTPLALERLALDVDIDGEQYCHGVVVIRIFGFRIADIQMTSPWKEYETW